MQIKNLNVNFFIGKNSYFLLKNTLHFMLICNNFVVVALMKFLIKYAMYEIDNQMYSKSNVDFNSQIYRFHFF